MSAHAPIEGSEEHGEFWSQLEQLLMSFYDASLFSFTMVGIDSNGKVGSQTCGSVGTEEPDTENANGFALRTVMDGAGLRLLNTFVKAGPTWTGSRGHKSRIDYLAIPQWMRNCACKVSVDTSVDLATRLRDDHNLVVAKLSDVFSCTGARRTDLHDTRGGAPVRHAFQPARKQIKFDSSSIKCPWYQERFREKVASILMFSGTDGVQDHAMACKMLDAAAEDLSEQILHAAIDTFPLQDSKPSKSWISGQIWICIQQCNGVRSHLRRIRKHRMNCMRSVFFMMWGAVSRISYDSTLGHPIEGRHDISTGLISVSSVDQAVALWNSKIPSLDWLVVLWGHILYKLCNLKQPLLLGDKRVSMQKYAIYAQEHAHDPKKLFSIVRALAGMRSRPSRH